MRSALDNENYDPETDDSEDVIRRPARPSRAYKQEPASSSPTSHHIKKRPRSVSPTKAKKSPASSSLLPHHFDNSPPSSSAEHKKRSPSSIPTDQQARRRLCRSDDPTRQIRRNPRRLSQPTDLVDPCKPGPEERLWARSRGYNKPPSEDYAYPDDTDIEISMATSEREDNSDADVVPPPRKKQKLPESDELRNSVENDYENCLKGKGQKGRRSNLLRGARGEVKKSPSKTKGSLRSAKPRKKKRTTARKIGKVHKPSPLQRGKISNNVVRLKKLRKLLGKERRGSKYLLESLWEEKRRSLVFLEKVRGRRFRQV